VPITFKRANKTIGHYYKKHDMWILGNEIETEINNLINK